MDYKNPYRLPNTPLLKRAIRDVMEYRKTLTQVRLRSRACNIIATNTEDADQHFLVAILTRGVLPDCEVRSRYPEQVTKYAEMLDRDYSSLKKAPPQARLFSLALDVAAIGMVMDRITVDLKKGFDPDEKDLKSLVSIRKTAKETLEAMSPLEFQRVQRLAKSEIKYADKLIEEHVSTDPKCDLRRPPAGADVKTWVQKSGRKLF